MNKARDLRNIVLGAIITASGLSALAAVNLTTFAPNTPIKSSEVNANFSSLKANIEALQAPGGISGTQLAASSVDQTKLAVTGTPADGKVLKLSGGSLAWSDDLLGNGASTYTADGTSLTLSGTTFSVKDGGITGAKLALPLSLNGNVADTSVVFVNNASTTGIGTTAVHGRVGADSGVVPSYGAGVWGESSDDNYGVFAYSASNISLYAQNDSHTTIKGDSNSGTGIIGTSKTSYGMKGQTGSASGGAPDAIAAIWGDSQAGHGVAGTSKTGHGVEGFSQVIGVGGYNTGSSASGIGVYGYGGAGVAVKGFNFSGSGFSGWFEGGSGGGGKCTFNGGSGWSCTSDRNAKENFQSVNAKSVLEALAKMPVTRWNMKGDQSKTLHLGPVAQDFKAAFGLGDSDKTINTADAQGVAFAAIKGLYGALKAKDAKIADLSSQVHSLEARLAALENAVRSR